MRPYLAILLLTLGCHAQTSSSTEIPANFIIPNPPPTASLSQWRPAPGRATVSLDLDNATLRGFRYTGADPAAPTLLFFNGNGMTIARSDTLYRQLAALGPTVLVYDYRAYGFSTGAPDLMTYRTDALRLYDSLISANPRLIVYGFSMGTTMASYIASERPVTALILAAPIASAAEEYPIYGKLIGYSDTFIATHKPAQDSITAFNEAALVAHSKAPLLILHGTADFLIPANQAHEVFAASPSSLKRIADIPDATHNTTPADPDSLTTLTKFLIDLPH